MKCPVCDCALKPVETNGVTVDVCESGCGGIWFDQFELQRFGEPREPAPDVLLLLPARPPAGGDPNRKRPCPRCEGVMLKRRRFSRHSHVEIDECGGCAGIWLDGGELAKIREERRDQAAQQWSFDVSLIRSVVELRQR